MLRSFSPCLVPHCFLKFIFSAQMKRWRREGQAKHPFLVGSGEEEEENRCPQGSRRTWTDGKTVPLQFYLCSSFPLPISLPEISPDNPLWFRVQKTCHFYNNQALNSSWDQLILDCQRSHPSTPFCDSTSAQDTPPKLAETGWGEVWAPKKQDQGIFSLQHLPWHKHLFLHVLWGTPREGIPALPQVPASLLLLSPLPSLLTHSWCLITPMPGLFLPFPASSLHP